MTATSLPKKIQSERGTPLPLGATPGPHGVNFSVYSKAADQMRLCLFNPATGEIAEEIDLDPDLHRTGQVWHIDVEGLGPGAQYGWRSYREGHGWGDCVLDPYAKGMVSRERWGKGDSYHPRGVVMEEEPFDWEHVRPPRHPLRKLVIYEMHVRAFTQDPSSGVRHPGSFLGVVERIPHLKSLGINAVELMPVQEFNELEVPYVHPETGDRLVNFWGYSTVNFFCPMARFASSPDPSTVIREFKTMVRELHRAGIEVILDVVFNHTAEGNEKGPTLSFRGLDEDTYYMKDGEGRHLNFSGCGNTMNCNHAVVREFIRDCLRYWKTEFRIDGFRFDLASILGRDADGTPLHYSPLIDGMTCDPFLADCKLIAEAWDAGGLYQVGEFYPRYGRWAEWNGSYRDIVRRMIKGTDGAAGEFATKLGGSQDLYGAHRRPYHSINFHTAHDGFTLRDLVSYNHKHNWGNGEENRDGANDNESWNCGSEGSTTHPKELRLRDRQIRNFHVALLVAQGVPMILMGDEYGHSKEGNNNTWCQDNRLNWYCWDELPRHADFYRFFQLMNHFRLDHPILWREKFLEDRDIVWHDWEPFKPDWEPHSRFVAFTLKDHETGHDLYIAFNSNYKPAVVTLPPLEGDRHWELVVNTAADAPDDFIEEPRRCPLKEDQIVMKRHSSVILKAK